MVNLGCQENKIDVGETEIGKQQVEKNRSKHVVKDGLVRQQFKKARSIDNYQSIVDSYPGTNWAFSAEEAIARIYEEKGRYEDAIEVYKRLMEYPIKQRGENWQDRDIQVKIGKCYEEMHQWAKAYSVYKTIKAQDAMEFIDKHQLLELEKKLKEETISASDYFTEVGLAFVDDADKAFPLFDKAYKLNRSNMKALLGLAEAMLQIGYHALHHGDESGNAWREKAREAAFRVIKGDPKGEWADDAQYLLAGYYYTPDPSLSNYPEAIKEYQKIVEQYSDRDKAPQAQYKIGQCYFYLKKHLEAIKEFEKTVKRYPNTQEARWAQRMIGACYYQLKNYSKAIESYQKTISAFPKSKEAELALTDIVMVYEKGVKDYQKAIETYQDYLRKYPDEKYQYPQEKTFRDEDIRKEINILKKQKFEEK